MCRNSVTGNHLRSRWSAAAETRGDWRLSTYSSSQLSAPPGPAQSLGQTISVRGSEARVALPAPVLSEQTRATVGTFLRIWAGPRRLIGMITEVESLETPQSVAQGFGAVALVDLMGEIVREVRGAMRFARGVSVYPAIGDPAGIVGPDELRLIYSSAGESGISIGTLPIDFTI